MKNDRKLIYGTLVLLVTLAVMLMAVIRQGKNSPFNVVFLDIGQGDSILISQGSNQILIDGGKDGKLLLEKMGKYVPFWDRNIELVVQTHPDADHIGGLIDVLRVYNVQAILKTKMQSDSLTFKALEIAIEEEKSVVIEARKDKTITFANGALVKVIFPFDSVTNVNSQDTNSASVVLKLDFGQNSFLFTGDLPIEKENEIIERIGQSTDDIKANVLKVGHHGSKYSSGGEFLKRVMPTDAIISVGKNNSYGHPNPEVLQRLREYKLNIFRTDEEGDIIYECQDPNFKCQKMFQ